MSEFASLIKTPTYRLMVDLPLGVCVVLLYASFYPNIPLSRMAEGLLVNGKESTAVLWFMVIALSVAGEVLATAGDMLINGIYNFRMKCEKSTDNKSFRVEDVCPRYGLFLAPLTAVVFVFTVVFLMVTMPSFSVLAHSVLASFVVLIVIAVSSEDISKRNIEQIKIYDFKTSQGDGNSLLDLSEVHYVIGRFFSGLFVLCIIGELVAFFRFQEWAIGGVTAVLASFSLLAAIHYRTFANKLLYKG